MSRDWQSLIRSGETVTQCRLCMTKSVVKGDGTGRRVCLKCAKIHPPIQGEASEERASQ